MNWISVKEKLPPHKDGYIAFCKHDGVENMYLIKKDSWEPLFMTHWMLLPDGPNTE